MSRGSKVLKTTSIYFIGNFASKLLTFFLLPLYTTYLTSKEFGQIDLLVSTVPLIAPIFTIQVTETVFRFLCSDKKIEEKKRSITTSWVIFLFGIVVFILLYIPFILNFKLSYAVLFFIYFVITYIGIFMQQVLRGLQRTAEYAITGVIATLVQVTLNVLLIVKFGIGGESLLISAIGASFIIALIIAFRIKFWKLIDFKLVSKNEIKLQLKYGIPLIPNQICWWIIGLMGKYILLYFHGSSENGVLAVATKFPGLITTISSIFFLAWTENVIREFESEDRNEYFIKGFELFIKFNFTAAACLLPLIKIYNTTTISGEFTNSWKYIPIFIVGALFNSLATFLGTIYTASMKTKDAFTTTLVSGITNLILSLLMIPFMSIWGVALANTLSFVMLFLVRIKSINKIINFKFKLRKSITSVLLFVVSLTVYYYLGTLLQSILFIILVICTLLINREIIIEIFSSIGIMKRKYKVKKRSEA
ncbi:hypothetical protein FDB24_14225 [Clostridium botulinum]|uniref:lipopolysaccharide biosynthesis protein n=1 Tax=Clostridium botulinum TaxID=1491 RepID=UPI0007736DAC|nr:polysaccharide biosynthesis C-terminal domain-containing protein [Clostridium botulinum]NFL87193.1 hypothetical protein [Clostridium botulinum]NFO22391.1 hypothetical protein [Clostridium botulinum]